MELTAGPVALITGSARRIGAALARSLHSAGWNLVLHHHQSHDQAQQLARQCNDRRSASAMTLTADLADPEQIEQLCRQLLSSPGRLDALIHSAALFHPTPLGEADPTDMERMLAVNALAPLRLCHQLLPLLQRGPGRILTLLDTVRTRRGFVAYDMSKAALEAMTLSLADEIAPVAVMGLRLGHILPPSTDSQPLQPHHLEKLEQLARLVLQLLTETPPRSARCLDFPDSQNGS